MTKQEFLAMSLPYNLKIQHFDANRESEHICKIEIWHNEEVTISDNEYEYDLLSNNILPILHPLTDLTKPITQKDYNNGEPFIPALELIKLEEKYNKWVDIAPTIPYDIQIINKQFGQVLKVSKLDKWVIYLSLSEIERAKYYVVSQLVKWHFDIANLIEKGEAIDVNTLEVNPYN